MIFLTIVIKTPIEIIFSPIKYVPTIIIATVLSCNKNEVTVVIDAEIVFEDILLSAIWEVASSHFHCEYPVAPSDFKVSIEDKDSIKTPFFF